MPKVIGTREHVHREFYASLGHDVVKRTPEPPTRRCSYCKATVVASVACPRCGAPA